MGPVLEHRTGIFVQMSEMVLVIGLVARKQYLMMRALYRIYAVDLHKSDLLYKFKNTLGINAATGCMAQALKVEKKPAGIFITN